MKQIKVVVINPGSTSTKLKIYINQQLVFEKSAFHEVNELTSFKDVYDQLEYRYQIIQQMIKENDLDLSDVDAFVGRGGGCVTVESGVYQVSKKLLEDIKRDVYGSNHASNLGVPLAQKLADQYGGDVYMTNPTCVDELADVARITGLKGVYRKVASHCLNLKGVGKYHARHVLHKPFEDCNFVIAHIDGGTTITASKKGRQIDCNDGAGGDGPFAATRCGSIAVADVLTYLEDHPKEKVKELTVRSGGLADHLKTTNKAKIKELIQTDEYAKLVFEALIYQCIKQIGAMAAVLDGQVDGILVTGGYLQFEQVGKQIQERCSWIADVYLYPFELEDDEMAKAGYDALLGQVEVKQYTGKAVFSGFPFEPKD